MQFQYFALLALFFTASAVAQAPSVIAGAPAVAAVAGVNPFLNKAQSAPAGAAPDQGAVLPVAAPTNPGPRADAVPKTPPPPMAPTPPLAGPKRQSVDVIEESIQGTRIGTVNDLHIFRGNGTYVFERTTNLKVVRKLIKAPEPSTEAAANGMPLPPTAIPSPAPSSIATAKPPGLPAFAGRPTPAPLKPGPWAATKPGAPLSVPPALPSTGKAPNTN